MTQSELVVNKHVYQFLERIIGIWYHAIARPAHVSYE